MSNHGSASVSSDDDEDYNPAEVRARVEETPAAPHGDTTPSTASAAGHTLNRAGMTADKAERPASSTNLTNASMAPASTGRGGEVPADKSGGLRLHAIKGRTRCLCVNKTGTLLCAGGEDGQLAMWDFTVDLPSRRVQPTRVLTPFVNRVSGLQPIVALHISTDGSYLVACQDGDSPALVAAGGKQLGYCAMGERGLVDVVQCKGHRAPVTDSSAHTNTGGRFYTSSQDGTARLWDQASFDRRSLYAVKHGSGQITDTVVVESVLSLAQLPSPSSSGGGGAVFATAGEDGCVQLWDSRVKYRPGGVLAAWDVYSLPTSRKAGRPTTQVEFFERHTGGLVELGHEAGAAGATLAVRRGDIVQLLDLRQLPNVKGGACSDASCLRCDALVGLSYVTDTTPLAPTYTAAVPSTTGFVTCTARSGFQHTAGGHVVQYAWQPQQERMGKADQQASECAPFLTTVWRAGGPDEDVLCAVADGEARLYAGLSSGDVAVQRGGGSPVDRWLSSRPAHQGGGGGGGAEENGCGVGRVMGGKAMRESDVAVEDLF